MVLYNIYFILYNFNLLFLDRGIRIHTPQGNLIIKLENEVLTETPNVALAVHAYDRMAAENSH